MPNGTERTTSVIQPDLRQSDETEGSSPIAAHHDRKVLFRGASLISGPLLEKTLNFLRSPPVTLDRAL